MNIIILACAPVALLCLYIYQKDRDKEPKKLLKKLFLWGMFTILPILFLELAIDKLLQIEDNTNLIKLFVSVFIGVALIEEGTKWIVLNKVVYNDKDFNHAYDAIVYCVFVSLGFALIENIVFVITGGYSVALLRALTAVPAHACDGVIMGYFLGLAKQEQYNTNQILQNKYMFLSLIIPISVHCLYDYFLFTEKLYMIIIFVLFVILIYVVCVLLINNISKLNYNFDGTHFKNKLENSIYKSSNESFKYALLYTFLICVLLITLLTSISYI